MENVWEKLKAFKGRPWADTKSIFNKVAKEISHVEEIIQTYRVNSEALPEEDREIYGLYLKNEPFFLERCKICSCLLKPSVINYHNDVRHKRNGNGTTSKKFSFVSPNKKKHSKKGSKSTSEDDSESVISSETWSPAVDLHETQSSDSNTGTVRDDSIVDIISVEEIPSEDSKPPTPGPQDLYEEFAVPCSEDVSIGFSSASEVLDSSKSSNMNSKPMLKLKIIASKETPLVASTMGSSKTQTTSLLEAHLLSNTKYSTSSCGLTKVVDSKMKLTSSAHGIEKSSEHENQLQHQTQYAATIEISGDKESTVDREIESWKTPGSGAVAATNGSSKMKTEAKISIPISALPPNVKIIGSVKKSNASKTTAMAAALLKSGSCHKAVVDSKDKSGYSQASSPSYDIAAAVAVVENESSASVATAAVAELSGMSAVATSPANEKSPTRSKGKRLRGKNRSVKNADFDPDRHCGVLSDGNKPCTRSLTCKTHAVSLRRAVEGRSKEFDRLLADHRASKEALKEHDRNQTLNLSEPIISIPLLTVDKIRGNTIQIPSSANNEAEIVRIRVPNVITNPEIVPKHQHGLVARKNNENEKVSPKSTTNSAKLAPAAASAPAPTPASVSQLYSRAATTTAPPQKIAAYTTSSKLNVNGELTTRLYDNDVKISFVCSDMLYKVGGLLYTDRSRQAIRKCMAPLILQDGVPKVPAAVASPHPRRKITDFLQLVKNSVVHPPVRLSLFKDKNSENEAAITRTVKHDEDDEVERMKRMLASSSKILDSLSTNDKELRGLRLSRHWRRQQRLKRPAERDDALVEYGRGDCNKKTKRYSADENYDIGTLFSSGECGGGGSGAASRQVLLDANSSVIVSTCDAYSYGVTPDATMALSSSSAAATFNQSSNVVGRLSQCSENLQNMADSCDAMVVSASDNESATRAVNYSGGSAATAQLLQTFHDLENEICNTVGANVVRELYSTKPTAVASTAVNEGGAINPYIGYFNVDVTGNVAAGVGATDPLTGETITTAVEAPSTLLANSYKGNQIDDSSGGGGGSADILDGSIPTIEETIRKNYSLLEEYCKNIATDELFLEDKSGFEFYENGEAGRVGPESNTTATTCVDSKLSRSNEIIVVDDAVFASDAGLNSDMADVGVSNGLHFDAQVLTSYLSSMSRSDANVSTAAATVRGADTIRLAPSAAVGTTATGLPLAGASFVEEQFGINQRDTQIPKPIYEDVLTLNEQFRDNTAVKIEKPPTPNTVFLGAENKEVLSNWLF